MTRTRTNRTPATGKARAVSKPHDPAEVQADKAADVVARGGSVSGWSFGSVPVAADVHREERGKGDDDPKKEAAKKTLEALVETKVAKDLQEKVKETPLVKKATDFVGTTPGKIVAGGAIAAGVGGLAAAKQPLPFQAPAVPIPKVPGLSAQVKVEGPVNAPTFVGLSLTYKEQGPKSKGKKDDSTMAERAAAFRAQRAGLTESFKSQAQKDQDQADEQAQLAHLLASQQKLFGQSTLLPLKPGDKPKTVDVPTTEPSEPQKEKEEAPVQREPASTAERAPVADTSRVDGAVRGGGRPLDAATRRSMEARFGYDFSSVRIHDDAAASSAAADVSATAFTLGEDVVLGGGYDPTTPRGRHLIAHELAHVVQQRGTNQPGEGEHLHRRSIFESIGILLGLEEGNWTDQELRAYLDALTSSGHIDGSYDADNKARAIVRKWKQSSPGWDLLGPQKALLIDEMIDGPTLDDDEQAILDLLELSDAGDLREIFAVAPKRIAELESNLHWAESDRLDIFVATRFEGGRTALLAGKVNVLGDPVPASAPNFAFDKVTFDARLNSDRTSVELIALVERFDAADQGKVLEHLLHDVWPPAHEAAVRARMAAVGKNEAEAKAIMAKADPEMHREAMAERIAQHLYRKDVPATKEALAMGTKPVDAVLADRLKEVLKPQQFVDEVSPEAKDKADEDAKAEAKEPHKKPKAAAKVPDKAARKPKFHDEEKYRAEIKAMLPGLIEAYYQATGQEVDKPAGMDEIERIAEPAKHETDLVFGQFYTQKDHPALLGKGHGGHLHSWAAQVDTTVKLVGKKAHALGQLRYYFQSDESVRFINDRYDAEPSFDKFNNPLNKEAKVLRGIADETVKDKKTVDKLVDTDRGWGGAAQGKDIFVDLFHKSDVDADRRECWEMFQTLVHEYMHTLVNDKYDTYATNFGSDSQEWNTLIEGVDCVLAEVVWQAVVPKLRDEKLRVAVEGKEHAKLPPITIASPERYASYAEAFRLADIVGVRNLYAAYFLGLVDRISVPKGAKAATPKAGTP